MQNKKTPLDLSDYVTPVSSKLPDVKIGKDSQKNGVYCLSCKIKLKRGELKRHSETKKHKNNVEKILKLRRKRLNKNI